MVLNQGIYSVQEAAGFLQSHAPSIRRWLNWQSTSGIITPDYQVIDGKFALSFLDLIEALAIVELRGMSMSLQTIRKAHANACDLLHTAHPFALRTVYTDGRGLWQELFLEVPKDPGLIHLVTKQLVIVPITKPFLTQMDIAVDFDRDGLSIRWWPQGKEHAIIIDPLREFGQPVTFKEGVPTKALACSVKAENGDFAKVARWYEVEESVVREAYAFETGYSKRVAA